MRKENTNQNIEKELLQERKGNSKETETLELNYCHLKKCEATSIGNIILFYWQHLLP